MRHGWPAVVAASLLLLLAAPPASAEHDRFVPPGLDQSVVSPNFVVHYDPDTATLAAAQALSADMEESHSRLVAGAGGTPNAGLNAPVDDSDGRTDVYMSPPSNGPTFTGGIVYRDTHGAGASYVFMTPGLSRTGTRFRSAHEYMHVIQDAYFSGGGLLTESTANWASEFALPDIDPQDSNFGVPHYPLDCSYGVWPPGADPATNGCGNGYRQYPFIWRLTQRYGASIVDALLDRMAAVCPFGCSPTSDRQILSDVIEAQPDAATLSSLYAAYARDVWDPARWQSPIVTQFPTTAMQAIHDLWGLPAHTVVSSDADDTGTQPVYVDHLAARHVLYRTDRAYEPSGPDDVVEVTVTRPDNQTAPFRDLVWGAGAAAQDHYAGSGPGPHTFTLDADPALLRRVLLPLVNDSLTDGQTFTYRIRTTRGTPTPPGNDTPGGAVPVARNSTASTNNVYAGGRGNVTEATGCGVGVQDATRGVWFRFTADGDGVHAYDTTPSDFNAVIAVYDRDTGQPIACSGAGQVNVFQRGGRTYDAYVGRWAQEEGSGTQARLAVSGPDAVLPEVNVNTPADRTVVRTSTPVFSGNASNRGGDSDTVRINLWTGGDTSGPPAHTFNAPRVNTSWSVVAPPLPNGVYTWRAELDGKAGTGVSPMYTFTLQGPAGSGPGQVLEPPVADDPPLVSAACRRARATRTRARRSLAAAKRALRRTKGAGRRRLAKARVRRLQRRVAVANRSVRRLCA